MGKSRQEICHRKRKGQKSNLGQNFCGILLLQSKRVLFFFAKLWLVMPTEVNGNCVMCQDNGTSSPIVLLLWTFVSKKGCFL